MQSNEMNRIVTSCIDWAGKVRGDRGASGRAIERRSLQLASPPVRGIAARVHTKPFTCSSRHVPACAVSGRDVTSDGPLPFVRLRAVTYAPVVFGECAVGHGPVTGGPSHVATEMFDDGETAARNRSRAKCTHSARQLLSAFLSQCGSNLNGKI